MAFSLFEQTELVEKFFPVHYMIMKRTLGQKYYIQTT